MLKQQLEDKGLLLTPDQWTDAVRKAHRYNSSYKRKFVDYRLWDVFQEVFQDNPDILREMRASVKDENITKQFRNADVMRDQFDHYLGSTVPSFTWNKNFQAASSLLVESIKLQERLHPITFEDAQALADSFTNKNASAGIIADGSKSENANLIFENYLNIKARVRDGADVSIPAMSFHRAQISNYVIDGRVDSTNIKYKDRLVWCVDAGTVAVESQFATPLIEMLVNEAKWYAGGKDPWQLRHAIKRSVFEIGRWYSLDFSLFDQTVPSWLIKHVFSIIKGWFVLTNEQERELDWVCQNFIHTSIMLPDGSVNMKHRGIPSGSNFTQVVGSMCNYLVIATYLISLQTGNSMHDYTSLFGKMGPSAKDLSFFIMGDDNLFFTREVLNVADLSQYVSRNFGMKIHPEKTDTSDNSGKWPVFLKRTWYGSSEWREPLSLVVNVIHPERMRTYDGYSPWHIFYGLYLTYRSTFMDYTTEYEIVQKMAKHGQVDALRKLRPNDLPGSLRIFGDKAGEVLYSRAKSLLDESNSVK